MRIVSEIEQLAGKSFGEVERNVLTRGADEYDLVDSGLEESMITAYEQITGTRKRITSMISYSRLVNAINKIGIMYEQMGIFLKEIERSFGVRCTDS